MLKLLDSGGLSRRLVLPCLMALSLLLGVGSQAFATAPSLPATGVDVAAWVPVVVTAFGTVVLAIVGAYFAFLLIKKGLQWGRKAFG